MTKIFREEIYSKPPENNYPPNKTDVYHIDDNWSLGILDLKDYAPENNRNYRYVSIVTDNFSKYGWTVAMRNENGITIKDSFENIPINSKSKSTLIETDRGKKIFESVFQNFLNRQ